MSSPVVPPGPGVVAVGSLPQARRHKRSYDAVLTIEDPAAARARKLRFSTAPHPPHLVLRFEDVDDEDLGYWTASEDDVREALVFAGQHAGDSILVHCFHGVGRSAGIALAILADRMGAGREDEAVADLFRRRPEATPNLVVVRLADRLLGRRGSLAESLMRHEEADRTMAERRRWRRRFAEENPDLYARAKRVTL